MSVHRASLALLILAFAAPPADAIDQCAGFVCLIDQPVLQAVAGNGHACYLLADGDVVCGGLDHAGQATGRREQDAIALASGPGHTCALLASGDVDCWGYNANHQSDDYHGGDAVAIDTAERHTCAVLRSGDVRCWGTDEWGQSSGWHGGNAVDVDLTTYYSCALLDDGNVTCWGTSDFFGIDYAWRHGDAIALGGGDQHTCVVTAARDVRCWGTSHLGAQDDYDGHDAVAVEGSYDQTCILTTGGDVLCQGAGTQEDGSCGAIPTPSARCDGMRATGDHRTRTDGRVRALDVSVYNRGVCYVLDDGTAECGGLLNPFVEPEPEGENRVGSEARGIHTSDLDVHVSPIAVEVDPAVEVPVRVCPLEDTCFGRVLFDPGTGPLHAETPDLDATVPMDDHVSLGPTALVLDAADPAASRVEAGELEACAAGVCPAQG